MKRLTEAQAQAKADKIDKRKYKAKQNTEIHAAECEKAVKAYINKPEGETGVVCEKTKFTAPHCPNRCIKKMCHSIEEIENFYLGV